MSGVLTLTKIHNPLERTERDIIQWGYVPGQSLADINNSFPSELKFNCSLNGIKIPTERLVEVYPHPGDHIVFVPVLLGGENGKMIGRIVGMIVLAAIAGPAGAMLAGSLGMSATVAGVTTLTAAGTFTAALAASAVMMVGGLLINALLPPPKPKLPTLGNNFDNSQAYSWSPQSLQQQGVTVPRWYGRNKLYGNVIAGYIQTRDDKQYLNALVALGTGPFFDIDPTTAKINDQFYSNFNGVTITNRQGLLNQPLIENFTETPIEHNLSQKVTKSGGVVTYIPSGSNYDGIEIEVTFPQGLFEIDRVSGRTLRTAVRIKVEISGPSGDFILSSEAFDFEIQAKLGWSLGYWVPISTDVEITGGSTQYNQAWVEILAGPADYIAPGGDVGFRSEGEKETYNGQGGVWKYLTGRVLFPVVVANNVDYSYIVSSDKKPYRKTWRKTGLTHGIYTIKVTRLTDDNIGVNVNEYLVNDSYLSVIREQINEPFTYPRQVLSGIDALATDQLSGSLRYSVIASCLYVRVWNGDEWVIEYNNNPSWVLFDVLTQPVYSGNPTDGFAVIRYDGIDPSRLDLPKFVEWAEWCDTLCPDGKGGTEKRITFNGGFDSETNLWDAAMQVSQVGGAVLVWNGVKLTLAIDKPSNPVQLFSVGNTAQDSFTQTFLSMEDRAAEIECDFANAEKDYSRDKLTVVNPNIKTISNKVNLPTFGITKPSEVWRIAQRRLAYNELISRSGSFMADIDSIACTVGDVIMLQSDVPQWGFGGRLVSATTVAGTTNLCPDSMANASSLSDFTKDPSATMTLETVTPLYDASSLHVVTNGTAAEGFYTNFIPVSSNLVHSTQVVLKGSGDVNLFVRSYNNASGVANTSVTVPVTLSSTPQTVKIENFNVGVTGVKVRLVIRSQTTSAIDFLADHFQVEQSSVCSEFTLGTRPDLTTSIKLDQVVELAESTTYTVMVRTLDDTLAERTVTNAPGSTDTLTLLTPIANVNAYDVYGFGPSGLVSKAVRVTGIQRNNDLQAVISWIEYNESVYNTDQNEPTVPTINQSLLPLYASIEDVAATELFHINETGTAIRQIEVSWNISRSSLFIAKSFDIFVNSGVRWRFMRNVSDTVFVLNDVLPSTKYSIYVLGVDSAGVRSPVDKATIVSVTTTSNTVPRSPVVDSFLISELPDRTRQLSWYNLNPSPYIVGYQIRYKAGSSSTWEQMLPLHSGLLQASPYETSQLAAGTYIFAIKSVDLWNNLSEAKYIEIELGDPKFENLLFLTNAKENNWPGTLTNCFIEDNILKPSDITTWADLVTWESWNQWLFNLASSITFEHNAIDIGASVVVTPYVICQTVGVCVHQMNTSENGTDWSGWVDVAKVKTRYLKIKMTVSGVAPYITDLQIYLDGKLVVQDIEDLDTSTLAGANRIGTGDVRLPLTADFSIIKQVRVALQNVGAGWTWELIDKNIATGPRIKIYNGSGVLADAVIDADIKGL